MKKKSKKKKVKKANPAKKVKKQKKAAKKKSAKPAVKKKKATKHASEKTHTPKKGKGEWKDSYLQDDEKREDEDAFPEEQEPLKLDENIDAPLAGDDDDDDFFGGEEEPRF